MSLLLLNVHNITFLLKRGADIAYRVTNQTRIERGILRNVVEYYMSWQTYGDDDLVIYVSFYINAF